MFFTYLLAFFGICIGSIIIATGFDDSPFFTRFLFKFLGISIFVLSITFVKVRREVTQQKGEKDLDVSQPLIKSCTKTRPISPQWPLHISTVSL